MPWDVIRRVAILAAAAGVFAAPSMTPFAREMLAAHNSVRAQVGVPALVWSDRLASQALRWGQLLAAHRRFGHNPNSPYGENLFEIQGARATPAEVVGDWAGEAAHYDYRTGRCHGNCGHYTQVVWRSTREVGCAVTRSREVEIWVCEYDPPGNIIGRKPY